MLGSFMRRFSFACRAHARNVPAHASTTCRWRVRNAFTPSRLYRLCVVFGRLVTVQLVVQPPFVVDVVFVPLRVKGLPPKRFVRNNILYKRAVAEAAKWRGPAMTEAVAAKAAAFDARVATLFPKLLTAPNGTFATRCARVASGTSTACWYYRGRADPFDSRPSSAHWHCHGGVYTSGNGCCRNCTLSR